MGVASTKPRRAGGRINMRSCCLLVGIFGVNWAGEAQHKPASNTQVV